MNIVEKSRSEQQAKLFHAHPHHGVQDKDDRTDVGNKSLSSPISLPVHARAELQENMQTLLIGSAHVK